MIPEGSPAGPQRQVKTYMRNGRLVRGYQRRGRAAAIAAGAAGRAAHAATMVSRNAAVASSASASDADRAQFMRALEAELRAVGASPADLVNDKMNGAAGKNPKAHAALLAALRKTGYQVKMNSDDEASGMATKGKTTLKIADIPEDGWDGVTYFDSQGNALDNRTRKPRNWSQPGK